MKNVTSHSCLFSTTLNDDFAKFDGLLLSKYETVVLRKNWVGIIRGILHFFQLSNILLCFCEHTDLSKTGICAFL